jgi:signal transduction histidine kinase
MDVPVRERGTGGPELVGESELRSVAQLKMLQSLARRLNQLNDVRQIGEAITGELRTLIDYHNCRVHVVSDDGRWLIPVAFRGELTEYQGETFDALMIPVGSGVAGHVVETRATYYSPNADDDPYAVTIPGTPELDESLLVSPLLYGEQAIGCVALSKLGIDQFDGQDMRLLEVLASHAAVAIANAQLLESERRSAQTSKALLAMSQALTGVHDTDAVLAQALRSIPTMIPCGAALVFVRDAGTGEFRLVMSENGEFDIPPTINVPQDVAERFLLSTEHPFVLTSEMVRQVPTEYRFIGDDRAVLVAPIRWEPDGLGAVVIVAMTEDADFTDADVEFARGIADITSLAYGNASRFHELQEAADRLRGLDEMKNTFLDAVSHELRTPLAAVLGIALTLERDDLELPPEESRELVGRLAVNARRLERLLSDLLDLDRLVRGIVEPVRRPTNVGELVRRVVLGSEALADRRVEVDLEPVVVSVDGPKVERIVENLVANTIRHTPAESTVWVHVRRQDDGALISVEDDGAGVPEELRRAIFEPFRQGPQRARHSPGVGIGLSLVSRFAELHGGQAWVEERPGGGASFRVFLPGETSQRATLPASIPA